MAMLDRPVQIDLPHLQERRRRNRWAYVVRRGKTATQPEREITIRGVPGSPEFMTAYHAAVAELYPRPGAVATPESLPPKPGARHVYALNSFGWLANRYFAESLSFRRMKPAGQRRRRSILAPTIEKHGGKHMLMPKASIALGVAERAKKAEAANAWLKAIKALYSWAAEAGIVRANPAAEVRRVAHKTQGYHVWSLDELRSYTARHVPGTMAYLAIELLLLHGLRRDDASKFGRQHISAGVVRFVTGKTEALFTTRASSRFLQTVAMTEPRHEHLTFLVNSWGRPFASGNALGNWFKDRCREAGIPHCSAHGVRKAAASIARTFGASDGQLDAMFTWADPDQRAVYTAGADTLRLATEGFQILESALLREGVLPPSGERPSNRFGSRPGEVVARLPNSTSNALKRKG